MEGDDEDDEEKEEEEEDDEEDDDDDEEEDEDKEITSVAHEGGVAADCVGCVSVAERGTVAHTSVGGVVTRAGGCACPDRTPREDKHAVKKNIFSYHTNKTLALRLCG